MGGFFLASKHRAAQETSRNESFSRAIGVFAAKGLSLHRKFETPEYDLFVFHKRTQQVENFLDKGDGDFVCATGTMLYGGLLGLQAMERLYDDFEQGGKLPDELAGEYGVVIRKNDMTHVFNSRSGLYHLFSDQHGDFVSSSFLASRRAISTATISNQSFYEYILNGAVYGNATLFREIRMLDCNFMWKLPDMSPVDRVRTPPTNLREMGYESSVARVADDLIRYFVRIRQAFSSGVCSALSGGYDSRLILGLMRRADISPHLYVYGSENDADVRVAKAIARGEGLELDHKDRENAQILSADQYGELLKNQYFVYDGMSNTGIFDNGQDLVTRLDRVSKAHLQLNGGGGEIYRNFWVLPSRSYTARQFLTSKYDRFDYKPLGRTFHRNQYFESLSEKVRQCGESDGPRLSRQQIAMLYNNFRLRYWMGMNNSINTQLAYSLTPFAEDGLARDSFSIPVSWKNEGRFEASVIQSVDKALAGYPSCYGFDFATEPSLKRRLKGAAQRSIPVALRPVLRRHFHHKGKTENTSLPYYLRAAFLEEQGLGSNLAVSELVDIPTIRTAEILSRVLSVELLIRDDFE